MRRAIVPTAAVVVALVMAACTGPAVDKQGGRRADAALTLHLGAADPREPAMAYFVDQVQQISHGRLAVKVDDTTYFSETRGGPARLAPDLRDGTVDLAMIPSRDWAAIGDPGFQALQSPFLVDNNDVTKALAGGAVARDLLQAMAAYGGVVGLGLVPAEPRRLLTRQPVVDAEDLAGARIRISDSDQTMALLRAMGADPVQGLVALDVGQGLRDGSLDGVELASTYIRQNNFQLEAPYLASFALIPKFEVLAASAAAWDRLSAEERDDVMTAAQRTVSRTVASLEDDDQADLSQLCRTGLVVVRPTTEALAGWRAAAPAPPHEAADMVEEITSSLFNHGPTDDASALPTTCPVAGNAGQARRMHRAAVTARTSPTRGPRIPPGTYEAEVTADDALDAGVHDNPEWKDGITFTYVLRPDGTFRATQDPDFPDQGPSDGRYDVDGYQVTFHYLHNDFGGNLIAPETMRWSSYAGTLTFTDIHAADPAGDAIYGVPWHLVSP